MIVFYFIYLLYFKLIVSNQLLFFLLYLIFRLTYILISKVSIRCRRRIWVSYTLIQIEIFFIKTAGFRYATTFFLWNFLYKFLLKVLQIARISNLGFNWLITIIEKFRNFFIHFLWGFSLSLILLLLFYPGPNTCILTKFVL